MLAWPEPEPYVFSYSLNGWVARYVFFDFAGEIAVLCCVEERHTENISILQDLAVGTQYTASPDNNEISKGGVYQKTAKGDLNGFRRPPYLWPL